jgi:hypothetical protein
MKNRKREICTSGSVRDEDGQPPHLLGRRRFLHLAAGTASLRAVSRVARAQAYPARPVRLLIGFAPGGTQDVIGRLLGQWLTERLGQQVTTLGSPRQLPDRGIHKRSHSVSCENCHSPT